MTRSNSFKSNSFKSIGNINGVEVRKVDYSDSAQIDELISLLQMYAGDPMGGNKAIPDEVINKLPAALNTRPFMHSFIAYKAAQAVGFANCIESFSTFSATSILNIHDFAVKPNYRGQGIAQALMNSIEEFARNKRYTKLTLEVLEGNKNAVQAYKKAGFTAYQLSPEMGDAQFWQKPLQ